MKWLSPPVTALAAFLLFTSSAAGLAGQALRVYSELARIDASGQVTSPAPPREILSPAIVRNGFTSFQIVVDVKPGTSYWLYVGENPDNAVKVTLYREAGGQLEPAASPYHGDATQVFWLDLWADRTAIVRRIKIEPELDINDDWVVYPMEVRVMEATVPDGSASATGMLKYLCGASEPETSTAIERLRYRNQQQDVALASRVVKQALATTFGGCEAKPDNDPERYLKIRDYLFRWAKP